MKKSIGIYKGDNLYLRISSYQNNKRIYIGLETEEELYDDVTINLSDMLLPDIDYIFIDSFMAKELRKFLEEKQIIGETIDTAKYNMGKYDIVKVDLDILKEYDSKGINEFVNYLESENKDLEVEL